MHFDFTDPSQYHALLMIAIAMALGGAVGYEREMARKPAGLRTHMLVAGAAALLTALGDVVIRHFDVQTSGDVLRSDPLRIFEAVVTGVSFLGAGTIIRGGPDHVEGLTTAASLLFVAGVGLCVATSQIVIAVGATLLVLVTLRLLGRLEPR
jgi:putative Mg2+ transporter-C (MgtC) family protein